MKLRQAIKTYKAHCDYTTTSYDVKHQSKWDFGWINNKGEVVYDHEYGLYLHRVVSQKHAKAITTIRKHLS